MNKLLILLKKEYLQLINDKTGLILMFVLPLLLVIIITIIQDSAFKVVTENKISILIVNKDTGASGQKLIELIEKSSMFDMVVDNSIDTSLIQTELLNRSKHTALLIPKAFSATLKANADNISNKVLSDLGMAEHTIANKTIKPPPLNFYHDPVLPDNYCYSLINMIYSFLEAIENSRMIESVYEQMETNQNTEELNSNIFESKMRVSKIAATSGNFDVVPNSVQHNVPAWTIFAMFFMVISLGTNVVKERINGSFIRLKTMPTSFAAILFSKVIVYLMVAIIQVAVIFSVGIILFPFISLPKLVLPDNVLLFLLVVFICSSTAVSYALMIGVISKTVEQSNGIGAVSVIIFAALGGIWVPVFVMPDYLQVISRFSPLYWCLDGFYVLFLKGGNWNELYKVIISLVVFIVIFQGITFHKLKTDKII